MIARRHCGLLALALAACGEGGREDDSSPAPTGTPAGSSSTGDTGEVTGGETSTGAATTDASSGEGTSEAIDPDSGTPPPDCGALAVCGVQCADLQSDPANCGDCGVSCVIPQAVAGCAAGACALAQCELGFRDCDGDINNGCEQALPETEECALVCKPAAAEACNLFDDDCDQQCDEGAIAGCRQPVHRASSPTLGHFYTNDAAEAMSGDFTPEALNFFYLYTPQLPGTAPLYRCLRGNGKRFYTTSASCEGAGTAEGILGHMATDPLCGGGQLFRMYHPVNDAHFYTTSQAEHDNAIAMYGYKSEGAIGYVWAAP